jgi:hypothetical protein
MKPITLKKSEYRNLPRKQKKRVKALMMKGESKDQKKIIKKYCFITLVRKYFINGQYIWRPTAYYNGESRRTNNIHLMISEDRLLKRKHSTKQI